MRNHTEWRRSFLTAAGVAAVALLVVASALTAPRLRAQAPATTGDRPQFDAASIKPNKSGDPMMTFPLGQPGGHVTATNCTLRLLIAFAYNLQLGTRQTQKTLLGTPDWIDSEHFDIEAEAEGNPSRAQKVLMVQSLLADRFKLIVHHEIRQLPVFELVLAKAARTGPQLQPHTGDNGCVSPSSGAQPTTGSGIAPLMLCGGFKVEVGRSARLESRKVTLQMLAENLSYLQGIDRPVVDRTGLSGDFDVLLEWTPQIGQAASPEPDPSAPSIFTAVQEQLGLKLESTTGPVDVLVIDHVEEPSPN
jgi:uncharacterized protein (TIGR03435 family)